MSQQKNQGLTKIANALFPYAIKIELFALLAIVLAFISERVFLGLKAPLLTLSLLSLAIVYYLLAFREVDTTLSNGLKLLFRIMGFGQAISTVGILFFLLHWPNSGMMLMTGVLSLGAVSVILVILRNSKRIDRETTQIDLIRSSIIILFVLGMQYFMQDPLN